LVLEICLKKLILRLKREESLEMVFKVFTLEHMKPRMVLIWVVLVVSGRTVNHSSSNNLLKLVNRTSSLSLLPIRIVLQLLRGRQLEVHKHVSLMLRWEQLLRVGNSLRMMSNSSQVPSMMQD
jgi:hypothetical protein